MSMLNGRRSEEIKLSIENCGVYFIYHEEILLYVGSSGNRLFSRAGESFKERLKDENNKEFIIKFEFYKTKEEALEAERKYIKELKPKFNRSGQAKNSKELQKTSTMRYLDRLILDGKCIMCRKPKDGETIRCVECNEKHRVANSRKIC